jgi:hypothetical protein
MYSAVVSDLNIPEGATALYNGAIDNALRALSYAETDIPTAIVLDAKAVDFIALTDYYTLEALLRHVPTFADITAYQPAIQKMRSQIFAQLRLTRDDAAQRLAALGYSAVSSTGQDLWQLDRVNLDYLEPNTEGW